MELINATHILYTIDDLLAHKRAERALFQASPLAQDKTELDAMLKLYTSLRHRILQILANPRFSKTDENCKKFLQVASSAAANRKYVPRSTLYIASAAALNRKYVPRSMLYSAAADFNSAASAFSAADSDSAAANRKYVPKSPLYSSAASNRKYAPVTRLYALASAAAANQEHEFNSSLYASASNQEQETASRLYTMVNAAESTDGITHEWENAINSVIHMPNLSLEILPELENRGGVSVSVNLGSLSTNHNNSVSSSISSSDSSYVEGIEDAQGRVSSFVAAADVDDASSIGGPRISNRDIVLSVGGEIVGNLDSISYRINSDNVPLIFGADTTAVEPLHLGTGEISIDGGNKKKVRLSVRPNNTDYRAFIRPHALDVEKDLREMFSIKIKPSLYYIDPIIGEDTLDFYQIMDDPYRTNASKAQSVMSNFLVVLAYYYVASGGSNQAEDYILTDKADTLGDLIYYVLQNLYRIF